MWSAFKISLDKADINELRSELKGAKALLVIVKLDRFEQSTIQTLQKQEHVLLDVLRAIGITSAQLSDILSWRSLEMQSSDSQVLSSVTYVSIPPCEIEDRLIPSVTRSSQCTRTTSEVGIDVQRELRTDHIGFPVQAQLVEISPRARMTSHKPPAKKPYWSYSSSSLINTPFGFVESRFTTRERAKTDRNRSNTEDTDRQSTHALFPSWLLRKLGLSYGLLIQTKNTNGWKCTLQPFNAVPRDAPIFKYCRIGDLRAVQTLLDSRYASVRDRDPGGRTPLSFASSNLHAQVIDYLLEHGADPHAVGWVSNISTIAYSQFYQTTGTELERLPRFLSTYERHVPDGYDDESMQTFINTVLRDYKPVHFRGKDHDENVMKILSRIFELWLPDLSQHTRILGTLLAYGYSDEVVKWFMRGITSIEGFEGARVLRTLIERGHLVHSMSITKAVIDKTRTLDLHKLFWWFPEHRSLTHHTMLNPARFFSWRDGLLECGHSLEEFTNQELSHTKSSLGFQGWTLDTLLSLFQSERSTLWNVNADDGEHCHRCGADTSNGLEYLVDLRWLQYLQSVREGRLMATSADPASTSTVPGPPDEILLSEESGGQQVSQESQDPALVLSTLPYQMVCGYYECLDKIRVSCAFDGSSERQPFLPPYPYERPVQRKEPIVDSQRITELDADSCPTKTMPGAFGD